jgi:hypothetical protein
MNKSILRRGIPILLAVALLIYALKDISFGAISEQFRQANYGLITLAGLVTIGGYIVRGKRWQLPLQALGYRPTVFRTTIAMQTGVVSSMIIIGSGELTRCLTLQRTDDVPLAQGIGSVVAERIIDIIMLALVLVLTALFEFKRMAQYLSSLTLAVPNTYLLTGLIGFLVIASLVSWWALSRPGVRNHPLTARIIGIIQGFSRGFMAIRQLPQPGLFIALTLLNQVQSWLTTYILLLAVDSTHHLPPAAALTIMAVSSIGGLAVPTQGGIGTYHFLVSRALVLYGFTLTGGAVVATFLHAIFFAINLLLSSISFLLLPALITAKTEKSHIS